MTKTSFALSVTALCLGASAVAACGSSGSSSTSSSSGSTTAVCAQLKTDVTSSSLNNLDSSSDPATVVKNFATTFKSDVDKASDSGLVSAGDKFASDATKLADDYSAKNQTALQTDESAVSADQSAVEKFCPQLADAE